MYVVYINLLYFLSIFLFTYNKNLLSQKKIQTERLYSIFTLSPDLSRFKSSNNKSQL